MMMIHFHSISCETLSIPCGSFMNLYEYEREIKKSLCLDQKDTEIIFYHENTCCQKNSNLKYDNYTYIVNTGRSLPLYSDELFCVKIKKIFEISISKYNFQKIQQTDSYGSFNIICPTETIYFKHIHTISEEIDMETWNVTEHQGYNIYHFPDGSKPQREYIKGYHHLLYDNFHVYNQHEQVIFTFPNDEQPFKFKNQENVCMITTQKHTYTFDAVDDPKLISSERCRNDNHNKKVGFFVTKNDNDHNEFFYSNSNSNDHYFLIWQRLCSRRLISIIGNNIVIFERS
jgi:hypothetical protein